MSALARLRALGQRLADACPPELGREIALSGSAASGLADQHSDLELLFLVDELPAPESVTTWLHAVGATDVLTGQRASVWAWCRIDGVEAEPAWAREPDIRERLDRITRGEVIEHQALALAHVVAHALPLRTSGGLAELAGLVAKYPERLRRRLIEDAVTGWEVPSPRLGAALRDDRVAVEGFLLTDADRILRIVFALNRRWELPSRWKWLAHYASTLDVSPPRLAERLRETLLEPHAVTAVRRMSELVVEVLELIPDEIEVSAARCGSERRLAAASVETAV